MTALPKIYTMDEAAEYLRVSRRLLQDIIKERPFYRTAGRRKLFTEGDLSKLIEALPCPSDSSLPAKTARRIIPYGAPTSGSASTELRELLTGQRREKSSRGSRQTSNVVRLPLGQR